MPEHDVRGDNYRVWYEPEAGAVHFEGSLRLPMKAYKPISDLLATSFEDTCRILDKCIERKKRHQEKQPQDDKDMDKLVRSRLVSLLNLDKLQVKSKEDNPEVCCGVRLKVKQFLDHIRRSKFIGEPYKDDLLDKLLRNLDPHAIKEVKGKQISEQCNHAETLEDIRRTEKRLLHQRNTFEDDLTLIAAYFLKR